MFKYGPVLAALMVLPCLAGCTGQSDVTRVSLGEQFSLAPGQSATITGEGMNVRFAEVVGDSRCPEGATCIWAGEVSCRLEITYQDAVSTKVLVQAGHSPPVKTGFADYNITFDVQPYPRVGQEIGKGDYRLILTIDYQLASSRGVRPKGKAPSWRPASG